MNSNRKQEMGVEDFIFFLPHHMDFCKEWLLHVASAKKSYTLNKQTS